LWYLFQHIRHLWHRPAAKATGRSPCPSMLIILVICISHWALSEPCPSDNRKALAKISKITIVL
jgi:hypothetical protein